MMGKAKTYWFLLIAIVLQACNDDSESTCIVPSGEVVEEEFFLDPFSEVSLEIPADVFIREGEEQQVVVKAQSEIIEELLKTSVRNEVWDIEFNQCFNLQQGISIYITIPDLKKISTSGSGNVVTEDIFVQDDVILTVSGSGSIEGSFEVTQIECVISGSGSIELEGSSQRAEHTVSGSGSIKSFEFTTNRSEVSISGSGSASISVTDFLDVIISGSGSVRYKGDPTIDSSISGSGSLIDDN